jgi:pilus assembly protein CpaB
VKERRRAALLLGLALLLGGLAASDVAGREAALRRAIGPVVPVVVVRGDVRAGTRLTAARLAVRRVPARFAPRDSFSSPADVVGLRTALDVPSGADLTAAVIADGHGGQPGAAGAPVRPGERVADVVAVGSPELVQRGARVDVLVTRDPGSGGSPGTRLALEDVEVLAAAPAPENTGPGTDPAGPRVQASLRVTLRQAVYLAAAQSFAREIRLLPRAAADRRHSAGELAVGAALR